MKNRIPQFFDKISQKNHFLILEVPERIPEGFMENSGISAEEENTLDKRHKRERKELQG